ncbi:MAG TPA: hypothetical protein PLV68_04570, partial [Ilumatobacteraceae bacterium]|nr:hypothetical protein [Ilumatobacteraceae bacterium]
RMYFEPAAVTDFSSGTREVTLKATGRHTDDHWSITKKPARVDDVLVDGEKVWHGSTTTPEEKLLTLVHNAGQDVCYDPVPETLEVTSQYRGVAKLDVTESDPCYIKAEPAELTGTGTLTTHLLTRGFVVDTWAVDMSTVPPWLTLPTTSGELVKRTLNDPEQSIALGFFAEVRQPTCTVQLPDRAEVVVNTTTRGTETIRITRPKVPRKETGCKKPKAGASGDPHMESFDGVYYEGQVRGEYVLSVSDPGALPVDVEIRSRQEPTVGDGISRLADPTSVTAVAVQAGVDLQMNPCGSR